jgi:hypothetical protein
MPAKTYQYSGKFETETKTKLITKNGQPISGQDTTSCKYLSIYDFADTTQRTKSGTFARHTKPTHKSQPCKRACLVPTHSPPHPG